MVGEDTYQYLDDILCRKLDRVRVKGKRQGVEVYQPLCARALADQALLSELAFHHRALELYWNRQWDAAREIFDGLHARDPATVIYQLYRQRIDDIRGRDVPEDWDGVYERRSK